MRPVNPVKLARIRAGLTQRELSKETGIKEGTISYIEQGHHKPRPKTLWKIARALGMDAAELSGEDSPAPKAHSLPETSLFGWATPLSLEAFGDRLRDLHLEDLERVGSELRRAHRDAIDAHDIPRAGDLYQRRLLLAERISELEPPPYRITLRPDAPPEVLFYRDPTPEEEEELREKYPDYVEVRDLVPAL